MAAAMTEKPRHYETIVVGAGMSGLSCASRLFEHGNYQRKGQLLVLEARNRIGGRVGSVQVNGCRLDTGANWIHGVGTDKEPNPLIKVLPHKRYRELSGSVMFKPPTSRHTEIRGGTVSPPNDDWVKLDASSTDNSVVATVQDQVITSDISSTLMGAMWTMIGSLHEIATSTSAQEAKRTTMLQAITKSDAFQDAFKDVSEEHHRTLSAMPQFVENMEAGPLVAQSAEHPKDQRGMSLLEYAIDDFDGDQVFLQDGYIAVVEEVAKHLVDAGLIQLGVEVKQIAWNSDPIVISTTDGTYTAKNVVCSLPLGVLQHNARSHESGPNSTSLFSPPLPQDKSEAIASLGFGTLDKIFLVYSHTWWTEEPYLSILKKGINRRPFGSEDQASDSRSVNKSEPDTLWGFTDELAGIEIGQDGNSKSGVRALSVINLNGLTGYPVLSSFISCANAVHVESLSDEAAGDVIHRALTRWFGREPPRPDAIHVTRWAQDKYSRGSYSHMITGLSETRHRQTFQQPIRNKFGAELRFAGEHTSRNHFATVHGALISGWREADAMLSR